MTGKIWLTFHLKNTGTKLSKYYFIDIHIISSFLNVKIFLIRILQITLEENCLNNYYI